MRGVAFLCAVCISGCASDGEHAEHESISLTVLTSGVPFADVRVWFQAADGALLRETRTDATGVASSFADDGASVTAFVPYLVDGNPQPTLFTIAGARAGDALVIEGVSEEPRIRNVHFELPDDGASQYFVHASCVHELFSEPSFTVVLAGCDDEEAFVIHSAGTTVGELYVAPVRVIDGMTIDLRDRAFAPARRVPIELASFPAQRSAKLGSSLVYAQRQVGLPSTSLDLSAGQASWMGYAPSVGTLAVEAVILDNVLDEHTLVDWGPTFDAVQFDGSMLLPTRAKPALDADAHTLAWSEPTGADFAQLAIQSASAGTVLWKVIAPSDGFTVTYPRLPAELDAFVPKRGDLSVMMDVDLVASTVGYDGLRAHYFERPTHPLVAGPQGRTVVRTFTK